MQRAAPTGILVRARGRGRCISPVLPVVMHSYFRRGSLLVVGRAVGEQSSRWCGWTCLEGCWLDREDISRGVDGRGLIVRGLARDEDGEICRLGGKFHVHFGSSFDTLGRHLTVILAAQTVPGPLWGNLWAP